MKKLLITGIITLIGSGCSMLESRIIAVTPEQMQDIKKEWMEIRPDSLFLCEHDVELQGKCEKIDAYFIEHNDGLTVSESKELKDDIRLFAERISQ